MDDDMFLSPKSVLTFVSQGSSDAVSEVPTEFGSEDAHDPDVVLWHSCENCVEGMLIPLFGCTCIPVNENIPDALYPVERHDLEVIPQYVGFNALAGSIASGASEGTHSQ